MNINIEDNDRDEIQNQADMARDTNGRLHGMTYEEGVRAGLDWILGNVEEAPIES